MKMRSVLKVENLELQIHLGWPDEERKNLQRVLINITFKFTQLPQAALTDDLKDTICYFDLEQKITTAFNHQTFKLIEHLAYRCYELIKNNIPADQAFTLSVTKFLSPQQGSRTFEIASEGAC